MLPSYRPGRFVICSRRYRILHLGDVVVVRYRGRTLITRITRMREDEIFIEGDNPGESIDSRQLGWLRRSYIEGVVLL